ncbi:class I SAM-dependent methyltransferase [Stappia sp. TSB10GB4]|uniref:class I SAM-dependent methyltransferase n=1 Tax=Stappia sp. TSB10GB4 TaxID=2003584 RepID=UPI001646CE90|nr:class I SAM-dependent methyltransferase [Stappia sp. TSB10GB4]
MSGFSGAWLSAREPADLRARNTAVRKAFLDHLERRARARGDAPLVILDLGAGTGATMRALHPHLRFATSWRLAEHDPALLALAREMAERDGLAAEVVAADLAPGLSAELLSGIDAVTTSAFLDLVSAGWIDRLARTLARRALPFLAMLTYDGRQSLAPEHPFDETVHAAMRTHQGRDKGFGPALGPLAHDHAATAFRAQEYLTHEGAADWQALPGETDFLRMLVGGWAEAARDSGAADAALAGWLALRHAQIGRGELAAHVGHRDLAALPRA